MVDESRTLNLTLPKDFPIGNVEIIVHADQPKPGGTEEESEKLRDEFRKLRNKHHFDEAALQELVKEGQQGDDDDDTDEDEEYMWLMQMRRKYRYNDDQLQQFVKEGREYGRR